MRGKSFSFAIILQVLEFKIRIDKSIRDKVCLLAFGCVFNE
ncbi:hypothetical protein DU19_0845 [Chlamydia muridarum]|nr:hypothetical protein TAC_04050 [Chlamydia muridarum str. Nigg3 CMUT3-5]AHH24077.1 hypothetical protein Y015_04050 [Chlamydia muridarum str. Nigg CM972]KDU80477.1 hypothetical protein DU17_0847 [Chlamydia muridarum]KDU81789.1 hypothetical protein DU18_0845 [Chlamydia muridarum]KDU82108.1 hypothetical protein DU19_0845 [Chlamydia muridarum]